MSNKEKLNDEMLDQVNGGVVLPGQDKKPANWICSNYKCNGQWQDQPSGGKCPLCGSKVNRAFYA